MSWKKYFKPVNSVLPIQSSGKTDGNGYTSSSKFSSWLPEVYQGPPDRLQRYTVYETMNYDHEINAALDTISDFCTEVDEISNLPFVVNFVGDASPSEVMIIEKTLKQWCILNDFNKRLWKLFRLTLMYGDQFFVRDPETFKLFWLDPNKLIEVIVNESTGKTTEAYCVKDLDLNISEMIATNQSQTNQNGYNGSSLVFAPPTNGNITMGNYAAQIGAGGTQNDNQVMVDANHIVHISLSDGMSSSWPFGESILEYIYKVYKQKELLEDSILIYRIHRAPERRVFFIDVGDMPPNKAHQYLERVKYEVQQKRIPSKGGGGSNVTDSTYNPMSSLEDYFFSVTSEGRGSKVETLPGGENLGDIDDLRYFNNKMLRALGVPSSYLPSGPEDGSASYNDGRVGTAFIQEFRFSKVCERYQKKIIKTLDEEFKLFLKHKGITIDNSIFELNFVKPQSFSEYRQMELDAARLNSYQAVVDNQMLSERFKLKRFMGLTEEEILENERMWKEENPSVNVEPNSDDAMGLSDVGISASGIEGMAPDDGFEDAPDEFDDEDDNFTDEVDDFGKD
jgi:hypothetical protein